MTADPHSIDLALVVAEQLERAEPDLLRSMLKTFVQGSVALTEAKSLGMLRPHATDWRD